MRLWDIYIYITYIYIYESYLIHEIYSNLRYNMIQQIENNIKMINQDKLWVFALEILDAPETADTPTLDFNPSYRQVFHSKHA